MVFIWKPYSCPSLARRVNCDKRKKEVDTAFSSLFHILLRWCVSCLRRRIKSVSSHENVRNEWLKVSFNASVVPGFDFPGISVYKGPLDSPVASWRACLTKEAH